MSFGVSSLSVAILLMMSVALRAQESPVIPDDSHEIIRLLDEKGKPERIYDHAFSSDGRLLALRMSPFKLRIIDLVKRKHQAAHEDADFDSIAFSSDAKHIVGIGEHSDVTRINIENGDSKTISRSPWEIDGSDLPATKVDIEISKSDGKLIVSKVGASLESTDVRSGDELISEKDSPIRERGDNSKGWRSLLGMGGENFPRILKGRANTWFQLRFRREGNPDPIEIELQRHSIEPEKTLPEAEGNIAFARVYWEFVFYSGDSATEFTALKLRDTMRKGIGVVSPDGKLFGWVAVLDDGWKLCAEVYSLETSRVVASNIMGLQTCPCVRFSANSKQFLVGTTNAVNVLDIESGSWKEAVKLPEGPEVDRVVKRSVPMGLGGLKGMRSSYKETVRTKVDALSDFDFSPDGVLAVGSAAGDLTLVYKRNGKTQFLRLGDRLLKSRAAFVRFNPTGDRLVGFANGNLHILRFDEAFRNAHLK